MLSNFKKQIHSIASFITILALFAQLVPVTVFSQDFTIPDIKLAISEIDGTVDQDEKVKAEIKLTNDTEINFNSPHDTIFVITDVTDPENPVEIDTIEDDPVRVDVGTSILRDIEFEIPIPGTRQIRILYTEDANTPTPQRSFFNDFDEETIIVQSGNELPDLQLEQDLITQNPKVNEDIKIRFAIENTTEINYSSDNSFEVKLIDRSNNEVLDSVDRDSLNINAGQTIKGDLSFQTSTTGNKDLRIELDENSTTPTPERSFFNNVVNFSINVGVDNNTELPDLVLTAGNNTVEGTEDESIQFKVNVRNTQETPYESDENTIYSIYESGTDNLIKTIVEDPLSLSQNESRTDILSITFSEPGNYEVDVLVNDENLSTPERSFFNNRVTITFTVEEDDNGNNNNNNNNSTLPDLDIVSIQAIPSIPKTGEEVTIRTRIQNRTEEDYFASNFKIQLIDITDSTSDELRTYNLGNLSLNGFETETFNLTYTFNESKDFDLQLFIPNQGDERSFFNNVEEFSLFVAPTDTPENTNPDLSIQVTAIPSQIRENDSAVFRVSITNVGDERYNTDVRPSYILRNTDTRITLETFIGDRLDLDPGESDTFEFTYRFTTPGSYPLEVELINTRGEINRSNNTDTTSVLVTSNNTPVNFPDLTINVTPSDTRIEQFDFVNFDVRISNIGTARYNVSSVPYFLILKDRDTGENLDFFTFNSLNIGPGSSETVEFRYRFTEEKTFDLEIELAGTIGESNFANNDDFVRIFVEDDDDDNDSDGRDLAIEVDYSPRNPEVDERVEFEVEIENVGDEDYRSSTNPTLIFRDDDNNEVLERFRLNDLDLDPGDTDTFEFTYRFDEDRRWDLEIELDGPLSETRTSNNIERFTIDVDDDDNDNEDGRDLAIEVDYSPRNPEVDERVEFEVEIENVGDEDYRSSTNPTLIFRDDDNNDVLRRFTLDDLDLDPGDTETFEFTYRFDEDRRWDLEIELDGPLSETRTSNNIERFTIDVDDDNNDNDDDGPDLLLDVDHSPRFPDEDERVEFEITIRNIGDEDYIARSDMEIEIIDTDTNRVLDRLTIDEDDFRLRDGDIERYELDHRFDDEGTYFLRAQIFPEGSGPREASTSNNREFFEIEVDNDRDNDDDDDDDFNGECDIIGKGTYYGIDDNESVQLGVAQSGSLEPCVRDADLDDYRWSVDDRDIATISDDGVLRARGDGRVTVTAEHRSEGIEAEQVILVGSAQIDDDFNDLKNELRRQKNRKYREILENLFQYLEEVPSNKRLKALRHKVQVMEAVENLYVHAFDEGIRGNILDETGYLLLKSLYIDEAKDDTIEAINSTATSIRSGNASSKVSALKDKAEFNLAWANQLKFAERIMPYKDTVDNVWYTYYVYWDTNRGIIDGYYDKQNRPLYEYRPGNNISVAEVIKIALESADVTIRNGVPDNTRARNNWTQKYIYTAEQENLTLVENNVDIHRPATRAEIVRAVLEAHNINPSDADDIDFDDVSESHEDADFIQHALEEGIISGDEASNNFRPDDFLNRAEVAKIAKTARENL